MSMSGVMKKSAIVLAMAKATSAADWNYASNGADWVDVDAACGLENQSPINLFSEESASFNYPVIGKNGDIVEKNYEN